MVVSIVCYIGRGMRNIWRGNLIEIEMIVAYKRLLI